MARQSQQQNPPKDAYSNLSETQVRGLLGQVFQGIPLSESAIQQYIKNPGALSGLTLGGQAMSPPGNQIPGASQAGYNAGWSGGQNVGQSLQLLNALGLLNPQQQQSGTPAPGPGPQLPPVQLQQPTPTQPIQPQLPSAGLAPPQPSGQPFAQVAQAPQAGAGSNVLNPIPIQPIPVQQYQSGGLVSDPYQPYGPPQPIAGYNNPPVGTYGAATQAQAAQQAQQQAGSPFQTGGPFQVPAMQAHLPPVPATMYTQGNMLYAPGPSGLIESGNPSYYGNATMLGSQLGAAALNMPMVIDLPPSGTPSSVSGVAKVGNTLIGAGVPSVPQGPWLTNPSVFARAAMPQPTATASYTPSAPAGGVMYQPGQSFASAPPAPGYTLGTAMPQTSVPPVQTPWLAQGGMGGGGLPSAWGIPPAAPTSGAGYVPQGFLQAHTSALANAGMALYSHMGGDPKTASSEDIANFHSQLTNAVGQYTAGAGPSAGGAKKMAGGGYVPGYDRGGSIQDGGLVDLNRAYAGLEPEYAGVAPTPTPGGYQQPASGQVWSPMPQSPQGLRWDYSTGYPIPQGYISPTNLAAGRTGAPASQAAEVPTKMTSTTTAGTSNKTTPSKQTTQPKKAGGAQTSGSTASSAGGTRPGDPDPDAPYLRAAAATPATGGAQPAQSATVVTPYPTTGLAPGETGYVTSGEPNWLQRAGQTIGHFFTGTLGQDPYQRGTWQYAPRMDLGGSVPDTQSNEPPEARRQALTTQSGTGATGQPSGQPSSSSAQGSSPQVGGGNNLFSGLAQAAHAYANSIRTPASGGGYNVPGGYIGASPGPGQSGYMYPSQAAATAAGDVGTGVGGGGMSSGLQSALGGIGSGLTQAAQAIASSVKPWQMQSYQNPYGSGVAPPPQIQMQPERVT